MDHPAGTLTILSRKYLVKSMTGERAGTARCRMRPYQRMAITAAIKMLGRAARALDRAGASRLPEAGSEEWVFELERAGAAASEALDRAIRAMELAQSAAHSLSEPHDAERRD